MDEIEDTKQRRGQPRHLAEAPSTRWWLRGLLAAALGAVIFVVSAGVLMGASLQSVIKVSQADDLLERKPTDSFSGRAVNIVVIGSDSRKGAGNKIDNSDDTSERSDTTMIVHLSKDRKRASIVSIPRDTLVEIPACKLSADRHTTPQRGQFNWAFALGGQSGSRDAAIACTVKTIESVTNIPIDGFVLVDFAGFTQMIDALGGIRVYIDQPIKDWHTDLDLDVGCHTMGGHEALQYARVRHGVKGGDGTDLQRIGRQQHVMAIMMREALSKNLLTSAPSLYRFARAGLRSLTTSSNLSDLSTLTGLAYSLRDLTPDHMLFLSAPVGEAPTDRNRVIFQDAAEDLWRSLQRDQPLPGGLNVKDGNSRAFVTPDPSAASTPPTSASTAPETSPSTPTPTSGSLSPSTTSPSAKEVERARRQCEVKG